MEITYRNLRPEDYDSLIQVWKASGLPVRLTGRDSREKITEHMKEQPDFFTGAFDRGRLIGAVIATSDLRKGWINRLAVIPEYQGRGVASELLKISEKCLINSGVEIISCLIMDDNHHSIKFFESRHYSNSPDVLYFRKVLRRDT